MSDTASLAYSALSIDDDELLRNFLSYALKKSGISDVYTASDAWLESYQ